MHDVAVPQVINVPSTPNLLTAAGAKALHKSPPRRTFDLAAWSTPPTKRGERQPDNDNVINFLFFHGVCRLAEKLCRRYLAASEAIAQGGAKFQKFSAKDCDTEEEFVALHTLESAMERKNDWYAEEVQVVEREVLALLCILTATGIPNFCVDTGPLRDLGCAITGKRTHSVENLKAATLPALKCISEIDTEALKRWDRQRGEWLKAQHLEEQGERNADNKSPDVKTCPLVLKGEGEKPLYNGRELPALFGSDYTFVEELAKAWPSGLSKRELEKVDLYDSNRRIDRILATYDGWGQVLVKPGQKNKGGYRITGNNLPSLPK